MKPWPVLTLALLLARPAGAETYRWPVTGNYDGDTIYVRLDPLPPQARKGEVRVDGADTPEIRGKCRAEKRLAIKARDFVRAQIRAATVVEFRVIKWREKYGRILARVTIDGRDLADMLIAEGLARPYGGEKRQSWCN